MKHMRIYRERPSWAYSRVKNAEFGLILSVDVKNSARRENLFGYKEV